MVVCILIYEFCDAKIGFLIYMTPTGSAEPINKGLNIALSDFGAIFSAVNYL